MLVELAMSLMFFAFCYEDRIISLLRGEMMNSKRQIIGVWDLCVKYAKIVTENCS